MRHSISIMMYAYDIEHHCNKACCNVARDEKHPRVDSGI